MKADCIRDYTTEVFRIYAALGKPTTERLQDIIFKAELTNIKEHSRGLDLTNYEIFERAKSAVKYHKPLLDDIAAVEKTIHALEKRGKGYVIRAIEEIYFVHPSTSVSHKDITERVRRFSLIYPADIATVYRWLKEARSLCAEFRGLRVSDNILQFIKTCE